MASTASTVDGTDSTDATSMAHLAAAPGAAGGADGADGADGLQAPHHIQHTDDTQAAAAGQEAAAALEAARQEAARLRGIFDAIQDALSAAMAKLEGLEAQVGLPPAGHDGGNGTRPLTPPSVAGHGRHAAQWKLPGWTPADSGDVVSGETLRARREALGISQAAVAHAAHCSRGLVAEVERGKRRSAQTLAHLSAVLDRLEQQARRN